MGAETIVEEPAAEPEQTRRPRPSRRAEEPAPAVEEPAPAAEEPAPAAEEPAPAAEEPARLRGARQTAAAARPQPTEPSAPPAPPAPRASRRPRTSSRRCVGASTRKARRRRTRCGAPRRSPTSPERPPQRALRRDRGAPADDLPVAGRVGGTLPLDGGARRERAAHRRAARGRGAASGTSSRTTVSASSSRPSWRRSTRRASRRPARLRCLRGDHRPAARAGGRRHAAHGRDRDDVHEARRAPPRVRRHAATRRSSSRPTLRA